MPSESGATTSIWMTDVDMPTFAGLVEDAETDVCVVGAGIAGLTTAYLLAKAGKSVLVLDHGQVGSGETGRTTAHLASAQDDRFTELERMHGPEGSRLAAESHAAAIDRIEAIVQELHIDCDFQRLDGYLFLGPGHTPALLDEELEAAQRAGLHAERLDEAPVAGFESGPCLRFPRQGQIHALKYLAGLARGIIEAGGRICTGAHVEKVDGGTPCRVEVKGGLVVTAGAVVVATNSPINDRLAIHTKQAPYRTYVVGLRVPRGKVGRALYWDTLDPYHYIRLQADAFEETSEVLIVGGEDEKTGQHDDAEARLDRLEAWTREHFPAAGEVVFRWSGQVMEPVDGMAFLGRNPGDENVYIATGDSGQGMTHGTIAGMLITDLILGRENPWESLYDPSRMSLRSLGEFARENLNVAGQYTDWATPGEVGSADEIAPGTGAVLRRGLHKIAAYRDESGVLHERSATCTHLGCVVHWNSAESIWNCPCHGGRFDPYGRVINGPPIKDLAEVEDSSTD